jgi:hypothetical protein
MPSMSRAMLESATNAVLVLGGLFASWSNWQA